MTKVLSIGLMSGLLLSIWACTEIDVIVPSSPFEAANADQHIEKPPITQNQLKELQNKKLDGRPLCNDSIALSVHPERQETPDWCWAATSKIVMAYLNGEDKRTHSQCQIVSHSVDPTSGDVDCCPSDKGWSKPECMGGGWPSDAFERHGFDYQVVQGPLDDWGLVEKEICGNAPFIYIINWSRGGKHALVAAGYSKSPRQLVLVYDPIHKDFESQTYEEFLGNVLTPDGSRPFSHDRNYVQIAPKAGGQR